MSTPVKNVLALILILAALAAGVFLSLQMKPSQSKDDQARSISGLMWPNPKVLQEFDLLDQNGEAFNLDRLKEHWSLLFFGYTRCPDICPATMTLMNDITLTLKAENQPTPQIVFISVDPDRDNQSLLKDYMAYFNPDFIGATADPEKLHVLLKQLGILSMKVKQEGSSEYLVDHSASLLLVDPEGQLLSVFSAPHNADEIRERYLNIRQFFENEGE